MASLKKIASWAVIVLVVFALLYLVINYFDVKEETPIVEEMTLSVAKTKIDTIVTPIIEDVKIDSIYLTIKTNDKVFFYIKIDSTFEVRKTGYKGNSYTYIALESFDIYINKGSAVNVLLNDSLIQDYTDIGFRINQLKITKEGVVSRSIGKIPEENKENENEKIQLIPLDSINLN